MKARSQFVSSQSGRNFVLMNGLSLPRRHREALVAKNKEVPYHVLASPKSKFAVLNKWHSYFLLVDNGTVGKHGAEIPFRKKLEKYVSKMHIACELEDCGVSPLMVVRRQQPCVRRGVTGDGRDGDIRRGSSEFLITKAIEEKRLCRPLRERKADHSSPTNACVWHVLLLSLWQPLRPASLSSAWCWKEAPIPSDTSWRR